MANQESLSLAIDVKSSESENVECLWPSYGFPLNGCMEEWLWLYACYDLGIINGGFSFDFQYS